MKDYNDMTKEELEDAYTELYNGTRNQGEALDKYEELDHFAAIEDLDTIEHIYSIKFGKVAFDEFFDTLNA